MNFLDKVITSTIAAAVIIIVALIIQKIKGNKGE